MSDWEMPDNEEEGTGKTLYWERGDGRLALTRSGRHQLSDLFGRVGIDPDSLRTREDYLRARAEADPHVRDHLRDYFGMGEAPENPFSACEQLALRACVFGAEAETDWWIERRERYRHMTYYSWLTGNLPDRDNDE